VILLFRYSSVISRHLARRSFCSSTFIMMLLN
jgi:hypothetical protein